MFLDCIKQLENGMLFREVLYQNLDIGKEQIILPTIHKEIAKWDDRNQNKAITQLLNIVSLVQTDFDLIFKELTTSFIWKRGELQKVMAIFVWTRLYYYAEKNILKQENILGTFLKEKMLGIDRNNENDERLSNDSVATSITILSGPAPCKSLYLYFLINYEMSTFSYNSIKLILTTILRSISKS